MKFKGTTVLFIVFVILGGYVYFAEYRGKDERQKQEESKKKAFQVEQKDISEISLVYPDRTITGVKKGEKQWEITTPPGIQADSDEWESLASSIPQIDRNDTVAQNAQDLGLFGLKEPPIKVTAKLKDGKTLEILFGSENPKKTTNYANIKMRDTGFGDKQVATTIGSSHRLNEHSRVYSEREHSTYTGNLPTDLLPVFAGDTPPLGIWNSDIYGYDTRLRDKWDFGLKFERRHLEASDFRNISDAAESNFAQPNTYNTVAMSWGYTDPKKFKFSDSIEVRASQSAPKIEQWVTQNAAEWKINQDLSFLGRMNFGTSRFIEPGNTAGQFTELGTGLAYRPVESDRLTWLTKYTFLNEMANDAQFVRTHSGSLAVDEQSHIFSVEGGYELTKTLQGVEKLAYRMARVEGPENQPVRIGTFLWVNRLNYHIIRKWDLGLEYRMLFQFNAAESLKHGPLLEIDREVYDYVRLGIGYNFTDFDDELRRVNDFRRNGFFVRLSGKV